MSRIRASTAIAALVASMAMMAGTVTLSATAASAAPNAPVATAAKHYPPPPPVLVVNKGVVKKNVTVRVTGRKFKAKEKVYIKVTFLPKGSKRFRTVKTATVRTDRYGKFIYNIKMKGAGLVIIKATSKSKQTGVASVFVIDKKKNGGWNLRSATVAAAPESTGGTAPGLAIAGIGVLALAGSALVTRQTVRRRRRTI